MRDEQLVLSLNSESETELASFDLSHPLINVIEHFDQPIVTATKTIRLFRLTVFF